MVLNGNGNSDNNGSDNKDDKKDDKKFEEICHLCHRSESKAGKMIHLPNNINICKDCMQKSFDMLNNNSFPGIDPSSIPGFDPNSMFIFSGPTTPFPDNQKIKKEEKSEPVKAVFGREAKVREEQEAREEADEENKKEDSKENPKSNLKEEEPSINAGDVILNYDSKTGTTQVVDGSKIASDKDDKKSKKQDKKELKEINPHKSLVPKAVHMLKDGSIAIDPPHKMKAILDQYIIGQDRAKKIMSVAVYNHYKRVHDENPGEIELQKSNILMLGPTGCGKTYMVQTLAQMLDVPLAIADATTLTEAGYIGDDVESVLSKLLASAGNDVNKAETGIVFIDEIDKIAKKRNTNSRDVSGESVQQGLLKLLEGANIEVPVGATNKNAMVPMATINTNNILFICGGAFPGLEKTIKERLTKTSLMGFGGELKDRYDEDVNILEKVTTDDLREFGMIPEFLGRLPVVCTLQSLNKDALKRILVEPKNAITKQYKKLLSYDDVELEFDDSALEKISELAMEKKTGARALRAIIEDFMLDIMYEIPKDENIGKVTITRDFIEKKGGPIIEARM